MRPDQQVSVLDGFSIEMTARDVAGLDEAATLLPLGTRVNIAYLAGETAEQRVDAARAVRVRGFTPVPHVAARRMHSPAELAEFLVALHQVGATDELFVVGGDPATPAGPFADSLSVLRSGLLQEAGVRRVGVAGYPEGHPDIPAATLDAALRAKVAVLAEQGLEPAVITQFGFDVHPVLDWIEALRSQGITAPVRVGVPGPVGIRRLLAYARRFGVATSASVTRKYGFSLANLLGTAGPDAFVTALGDGLAPGVHGEVRTHFYTFGGLPATSAWVRGFAARPGRAFDGRV
ncbi:methylenetetrahydrofolate reductase [Pseudonocardia zijingensis]|jgi:methylenetetrahydrofolate reductase (NADPH)|uniref:Methylenetetrahydrofolate reductase n=1 Tax=Pseudonocardia zijingensis TaxID=153376 RepID=A0ABP3ZUN4_9PSEU